jgi:tetratricopeptide (TPR) repeat protein
VVPLAGWFGWHTLQDYSHAIGSIPQRPKLTAFPSVYADQLAEAETKARKYFGASDGVAELARLYHANGFFREANQCYAHLVRVKPSHPQWPHLWASVLAGFGRLDHALPLLRRTVELAPEYTPAQLRLAEALLKNNQASEAVVVYKRTLERDSSNAYAQLGLARCSMAQNRWEDARDRLQSVLTAGPDKIGGWATLVTIHEQLGDKEAAAAALRRARGSGRFREMPDPWLDDLNEYCFDPYRLGVIAAMTGDKVAARRWLDRAITFAANPAPYHRQLGKMLWDAKNLPDARLHLEKAVGLDLNNSDAWAFLVGVYHDAQDGPAGDRTLAKALTFCPQSPALRHLNGQRLRKLRRLDLAETELLTSIRLQPNEARAHIELAMVYFEQNRTDDGIASLRAAVVAEPSNTLAMQVLARHSINEADQPAALHWIKQLRQQPNSSDQDMANILNDFRQQFGRDP